MQTKHTLFAVLFALSIVLGITCQGTRPAQADGPSDTWQPSPAYLAAQARFLNFKTQQHDRYFAMVGRSVSTAVPRPQERFSAWKSHLSVTADGSRNTPSVVPQK